MDASPVKRTRAVDEFFSTISLEQTAPEPVGTACRSDSGAHPTLAVCLQIQSPKAQKYVIPSRYRACVLKCLCGPLPPGRPSDKAMVDSIKIESTSAVAYIDHGPLSGWKADMDSVELPEIDGSVDLYVRPPNHCRESARAAVQLLAGLPTLASRFDRHFDRHWLRCAADNSCATYCTRG
jgi:hypothetical protein